MPPNGSTTVSNVILWAITLLEKFEGPLKLVVRIKAAQKVSVKIRQSDNTGHDSSNNVDCYH